MLIVDDEASARELLQRHLTREGFRVSTATGGRRRSRCRATDRADAVLLDVMLPGIDGWHVLKALRDDPATADIPVIMQTLLNDEHFASRAWRERLSEKADQARRPAARRCAKRARRTPRTTC